jgi:Flp pilus assembly protein TadD
LQSEDYRKQGNEFLAAGNLAQAEACYRQAVAAAPASHAAHVALGFVLLEQGRLDEAGASLRQAVAIDPREADGHYLLGMVAQKQGRAGEAAERFRSALEANPKLAQAHYGLGIAFRILGRNDEALRSFDSALSLKPDFREARLNKALLVLLRGNFAEGLELLENRLGLSPSKQISDWMALLATRPEKRRWRGEDLAERKLLIWTEEGMGDCMMVMRYLPKLENRGAGQVLVLSDPSLARLMRAVPGVSEVITDIDRLSPDSFDRHCPIMSLPFLFGTRGNTIPNQVPYLSVPDELREKWRLRLAELSGLKVGLVWAGSTQYGRDAVRSLALGELAPLFGVAGVSFVSLQKGDPAGELAGWGWPVFDPMDECEDFMETAAVAVNLDLVVSVDTSVAHLAGALGRPVWLLNRFESEWRWQLGREDSPWYPTMRLFSQPAPGDWASVVRRVAGQLASLRPQ